MSSDNEFLIDLDGPTLAAFTELVTEHCSHLLHEFFGEFSDKTVDAEKEKTMAVLCLTAASSVQAAMRHIIMNDYGMPENIAGYIEKQAIPVGRDIARNLLDDISSKVADAKRQESASKEQEESEEIEDTLSYDSLIHTFMVPGGEA